MIQVYEVNLMPKMSRLKILQQVKYIMEIMDLNQNK